MMKSRLAEVPRERVLTETDGPFVSVRKSPTITPAKPIDVAGVVDELSKLWSVEPQEARAVIYRNFAALLSNR